MIIRTIKEVIVGILFLVKIDNCSAITSQTLPYDVPTFTHDDLQSGLSDERLKDVLTSTGLLAVRVSLSSSSSRFHGNDILQGLCSCAPKIDSNIPGGDRIRLKDGVTTRSTIATATYGLEHPLELPQREVTAACGSPSLVTTMEETRDAVSKVTSGAFIPALDRLIGNSNTTSMRNPILTKSGGEGYDSISSVMEDAVHLEHFHVYSKDGSENDEVKGPKPVDSALDWHTDAGLFLSFLPGMSCGSGLPNKEDSSFRVLIPKEDAGTTLMEERVAVFPKPKEGEAIVAIMLGTGSQYWLDLPANLQLKATKHAVKMRDGESRVWYGMMSLVSSQAIVQSSPKPMTFSEMKNSVATHTITRRYGDTLSSTDVVSIGCGMTPRKQDPNAHPTVVDTSRNSSYSISRRRLQHGVDPSECSNSAEGIDFYCWMQCPVLKGEDLPVQKHLDNDESIYCLNESILVETNGDVIKAIEACTDGSGVVGGVMDPACTNVWHPTVDGAFTYLSNDNRYKDKYCYGGTSMYMNGFVWESSTCVIYLFQPWVITTRLALILACFGTIIFGIVVELLIKQRQLIVAKIEKRSKKIASSAVLYAIQLALAYGIMLVIMTYSGPLVLCVIIGLVTGHVLCFGTKNILCSKKKEETEESEEQRFDGSTPCCLTDGTSSDV